MIASSSSSPPTRMDWETTIPPSEMTATSLVPPPMSTTIEPVGSPTGRPAPIAAAPASPTRDARREPPPAPPGADRRGHRLLDQVRLTGSGGEARLLDGALLDAGHPAGHADHDARGGPGALMHLLGGGAGHALR